ncbi:hypothetical protein [Burkholderia phage CSP3]|nr:hypothetical protein [Burkholderia phage CSP3]
MAIVQRKCEWCRKPFEARSADVKRGWARFCSKSCKAKKQEKRTGQFGALLDRLGEPRPGMSDWERRELDHENALYESTSSHGQDNTGGW